MHISDTVITVVRQGMELQVAGLGDVITILPFVRGLARADDDIIFLNLVRLMDTQTQAVYTVAAVDTRHHKAVFTRCTQYLRRVFRTAVLGPLMQPKERRQGIGDMYCPMGYRYTVAHR